MERRCLSSESRHHQHSDRGQRRLADRIDDYGAVVRQLAREFQAQFVPLQEPFDRAAERTKASDWIFDGVHPTAAGNRLIANAWLDVVQRSILAIR
ncbi:GDSL-type esterase/lipase family protein [Cohnella rhizosphaerae]|uniref:GDSL-type esterase/lipase family protein n=1 Tax=Cohnella rhizosphaerae TaxID=1457232 RepID=UPI003B8A8F50